MKRYFIPLLLLFTPLLAHGQIISSGPASCAILEGGSVKCWGYNNSGNLGQGHTQNRGDQPIHMGGNLPAVDLGTGRTAVAVSSGQNHTCALLDDGSVKCWGNNIFGQLGQGDRNSRGDAPGEVGDALPAIDLGTGRTATAITTGQNHTCALLDDGSVKCWGQNSFGQLGQEDASFRGDLSGEMGNALPAIDLGTGRTATAIATGAYQTCALLDNGSVKCWGLNNSGQLGYGDMNNRGVSGGEMGDALPAIDLGTGRTAVAITTGQSHTCALLDDDSVKCWGLNNSGQLGYGDTNNRGDSGGEMGDNLPVVNFGTGRTAVDFSSGLLDNTCALLDNDTVKCWGYNTFGQLGYGDRNNRGDNPDEMGDNLPAVDLGGGVLPVELTTFTATLDGSNALLRWTTASETNNAGFDVEHRQGTQPFRTLGFAAGRGTTAETSSYHFTAADLQPGTHVFRLRQIDFDGAFAYSPEVELTVSATGASLTLLGNPASEAIRGALSLPVSQTARVVLFDVLGRRVLAQEGVSGAFTLDVSSLPSGAYVLRVEAGSQTITRQVVVAR